jgi:hypothetical protein
MPVQVRAALGPHRCRLGQSPYSLYGNNHADVIDLTSAVYLPHGQETVVFADAGFQRIES